MGSIFSRSTLKTEATTNYQRYDDHVNDMSLYPSWQTTSDQRSLRNTEVYPQTFSDHFSTVPQWSATSSYPTNHMLYPIHSLPMNSESSLQYHQPQNYRVENRLPSTHGDDRSSKKVQFGSPYRRDRRTAPLKPLTNTQSWHESSISSSSAFVPIIKPIALSSKPPICPPARHTPTISTLLVGTQKAVYTAIDHGATIAERNQSKVRHSSDSSKSDESHSTNHTRQNRSHRSQIDLPSSSLSTSHEKVHKSMDSLSRQLSDSQRSSMNTELHRSASRDDYPSTRRVHRRRHHHRFVSILSPESSLPMESERERHSRSSKSRNSMTQIDQMPVRSHIGLQKTHPITSHIHQQHLRLQTSNF